MRKVFLMLFVLMLFSTSFAHAGSFVDGMAATGEGTTFPQNGVKSVHAGACWYTDADASITAVTIALEGSIDDGTHWHTLASHNFTAAEITAKSAVFFVANAPVNAKRFNMTTLTGGNGTTDLVYCAHLGD